MRMHIRLVLFMLLCAHLISPALSTAWDALVDTIWTVTDHGGRVDWSPSGNDLIAFDRIGPDSLYDLYLMNPDGSGVVCLTDRPGLIPQKNNGQPTWHPSGRYIVLQMEKDENFDPSDRHFQPSELSKPGRGWNCDLWCVDLEDTSFHRLTNLPTRQTLLDTIPTSGALHPHFSHDGSKLLWSELLDGEADIGDRGNWGQWRLNLSEFVADSAGPHLGHTEHFERGLFGDATFYESHDFSADDRLIMFSGNLAPGQHQTYFDIYTIDVLTHDLNRLTFTTENVWDEHAHFQPNSGKIVWICSQGYSFVPEIWALTMRTEYWLMNPDGTDKRRLTYFNDSAHTEYTGARVIVADCSWSPAGDRLIALSLYDDGQTTWGKVFMVEFADTPVEEVESPRLPYDDLLDQNYPNPFNSQTAIGYHLPEEGSVVLDIYNIAGQRVRTLVNRRQAAGMHAVIWDGRDDLGAPIGSGVYLYRLQIDQSCCPSKKMILLR